MEQAVSNEPTQPNLAHKEILGQVEARFGLSGQLSPLQGEWDQNLKLHSEDGSYTVKISPASRGNRLHPMQQALLQHLDRTDPGLRIPKPVATVEGAPQAEFESGGTRYVARVLNFVPGKPLRSVEKTPELLEAVGRFMGRLTLALQSFGHPGAYRYDFLWNLENAERCAPWTQFVEPGPDRQLVEAVFQRWLAHVKPALPGLPAAVVHHDANDDNIIVEQTQSGYRLGLIDFGDAVFGRRVSELAVTLAYALMDVADLSSAARTVIRGYSEHFKLNPSELALLPDLVSMRLAMSLCISHKRKVERPSNNYLQVSQRQATTLLERLQSTGTGFISAVARSAAGLPATPNHDGVVSWLRNNRHRCRSVLPFDLNRTPRLVLSLSPGGEGTQHSGSPSEYQKWLEDELERHAARYAIGCYGEDRDCYTGSQFVSEHSSQPRSVHLGIDLFVEAGTPVNVPLPGQIKSIQDNNEHLDYGPTVIVEHRCGDHGPPFWTLYGHLSTSTLTLKHAGDEVAAGECIGYVGTHEVNGDWAPHLHFQIMTDLLGRQGNFHGAGEPSLMDIWRQICPDPNLILGLAPESFVSEGTDDLHRRRSRSLGPSLSLSYDAPLEIVRGRGPWLYDSTGRAYLDCVNNICHVGHCHPRVLEALYRQAAKLNTNTRYLHPNIVEYAERLLSSLPDSLSVCYFVCSGSEANELALRMARAHTGREDVIVLDWGYHGNTQNLVDISPYKFKRKGGNGKPSHVHVAELPDPFRGPHRGYSEESSVKYAQSIDRCVEQSLQRSGNGPAAFIAESIPGCGGQVLFPDAYLQHAYRKARDAGGVCIADEVQTGFGRVGESMWAFELQGAVPDIVTLGKPMGNGHPLAAVVTTREIADSFANGMEYFNSFGGNPVSCAVGMAVLDVMEREDLQSNARETGGYLLDRLNELKSRHNLIGDVRGKGLFIGVELVSGGSDLEPAAVEAKAVINDLCRSGVLLSTDGPNDNVLKIKPPMVFKRYHADLLADRLDLALGRD